MKTFHLAYWTTKPYSVLMRESKRFRNTAEVYMYILEKKGTPVIVSENSSLVDRVKS